MVWIMCCGFHSHQISIKMNIHGRFWRVRLDSALYNHHQNTTWGEISWMNSALCQVALKLSVHGGTTPCHTSVGLGHNSNSLFKHYLYFEFLQVLPLKVQQVLQTIKMSNYYQNVLLIVSKTIHNCLFWSDAPIGRMASFVSYGRVVLGVL